VINLLIPIKNKVQACFFVSVSAVFIQAQTLPPPAQVIQSMTVVNKHFMKKWPDPATMLPGNRPSNIWTRAAYFEGDMAMYFITLDTSYYNYAVRWGTYHNWGLRTGDTTKNADNQCAGQIYVELYQLDQKAERISHIKPCIDSVVKSARVNYWTWIDAIQMAMPVFTKLGVVYNDTAYFRKMYSLYNYAKATIGLYNGTTDHLWWRDTTFKPPYTEPNGRNCYWSRGNGWVFAALARVLDVLPLTDSHRSEYIQTFTEMAGALRSAQRTDGFWNVSLQDPTDYGGPEVTGTSLFTFGMAWGIRKGFLDSANYKPVVAKAWNGMVTVALRADSVLGYYQGTGNQPSAGQPVTLTSVPDFDDFGVGCFLLAGSEVYRLSVGTTRIFNNKEGLRELKPEVQISNKAIKVTNSNGTRISFVIHDLNGRQILRKAVDHSAEIRFASIIKRGTFIIEVEKAGKILFAHKFITVN